MLTVVLAVSWLVTSLVVSLIMGKSIQIAEARDE